MSSVAGAWLEITDTHGTRREGLQKGLTRVGGGGAEIALGKAGEDQLHIWDEPPRAVFLGDGRPPSRNGKAFEEVNLRPGDVIHWAGVILKYGVTGASASRAASLAPASLEEVDRVAVPQGAGPASGLSPEHRRVWTRVVAGMMVELGMAEGPTVKRWQQRVLEGDYDADQCATEVFESGRRRLDDLRLLERAGRLQRDFLMTPLTRGVRGVSRRARKATKSGVAFLVAQFVAIGVYTLVVMAIMAFLRKRGVSFDGMFDSILPG